MALSTDSIIQILSTAVLATVGIAAAFIASRTTEKYRDQNENASEHFKQIKARVLEPMLKQTDQYYLPVLEFRKENLTWDRKDTRKFAAGLGEQPKNSEVVASIIPFTSPPSRIAQDDDPGAHIEKELYGDSKNNHFKALFVEWEKLTSRAAEFNRDSLELANSITDSIAKKLSLPVVNSWEVRDECVTPYCGVAIFNRMAGTGGYALTTGVQNNLMQISFGNFIIQMDPNSDVQRVRQVIDDEIAERRQRFFQLKAIAEQADQEFVAFRAKLAAQLEKQKLPGKCDYI